MIDARTLDKAATYTESSGKSPGAILKRCREYRGLSLEEAAETTKVSIFHLRDLEEDHLGKFANMTYLKGFLRIYASYLGLNSDDMVRMYDKLNVAKDAGNDSANKTISRSRPLWRIVSLQKLALPAFLLSLILITATFLKRSPENPARPYHPALPTPLAQLNPVQPLRSSLRLRTVAPETEKPRAEVRDVGTETNEKQLLAKRSIIVDKSYILKIRATQNCTLTATIDGSIPQNYELAVGDIIEWKAEKSVTLDLSNASGIEVELNGKPYKQLGPSGKPVYVELDADGIKQ